MQLDLSLFVQQFSRPDLFLLVLGNAVLGFALFVLCSVTLGFPLSLHGATHPGLTVSALSFVDFGSFPSLQGIACPDSSLLTFSMAELGLSLSIQCLSQVGLLLPVSGMVSLESSLLVLGASSSDPFLLPQGLSWMGPAVSALSLACRFLREV